MITLYLVVKLIQATVITAHKYPSMLCANDFDHVDIVRRHRDLCWRDESTLSYSSSLCIRIEDKTYWVPNGVALA